jgi:hypothetical protein
MMSQSSFSSRSVIFNLHPDSQPLFAFEDPTNPSQQLTWTVLPQGFRDSAHVFGQALTRDFLGWHYPEATLLQYVDDLFLCGATENLISRVTESLSNFWPLRDTKSLRKRLNYASLRSPT